MRLLKIFIFAALIAIVGAQNTAFAEMPEISAGEMYFDVFKGCYVLRGNVSVGVNNHGFKANVTADAAQVSVIKQKCWAEGNVKLTQENITFSCDRAYLQWQTKTAEVTGSVKFANKKSVAITSDTAVFNWQDKIVDFYGNITLNAGKKVALGDGVTIDGKEYQHVQYNVEEDKILALDKIFDAPEVTIPDSTE
ncbi:MAG: hypothetical protein SR1Q7_06425 [Quinella sp. 1Q7]|nr:hypothetical protein [Quinella sp. 1Q7]